MLKRGEGPHAWFGKYLSLALTLPAAVAGGYLIGRWLDDAFHKSFFTALLMVLGMIGGIVQVIRELMRDMDR